jgi:amino acid permease
MRLTTTAFFLTFLGACVSWNQRCSYALSTSILTESMTTKPRRLKHARAILYMQQPPQGGIQDDTRRSGSNLAAATTQYFIPDNDLWIIDDVETREELNIPDQSLVESFIVPVVSASMMITGNTVGAGMLVLPDLVSVPGPMLSFSVFFGAWFMNLISGLTIAQVAIQQHERSGSEVPSSFKEFAEATLPKAANLVSGISIFINSLIMVFDIFKAGQIGTSIVGVVDAEIFSYIWAGLLTVLVSTQSLGRLSQVASMLVVGLFATFSCLLLPGLAHVADPIAGMTSYPAPTSTDLANDLLHMTPVVITTLVFQNIVPTITQMLEYDRVKIATAITFGSIVPLFMYMAWCIVMIGGGIDASSLALGGLISIFSLITAAGSSLGTSMSLSEEFRIILGDEKKETFSLQSVALPIGIALIVGRLFSTDITYLLEITGSYGSPILYGGIPVAMALMMQRQVEVDSGSKQSKTSSANLLGPNHSRSIISSSDSGPLPTLVPGGVVGLGVLGFGTTALIGTELFGTLNSGAL